MDLYERYAPIRANQFNIATLKEQLQDTDYKALKYAEGLITEAEYAETKEQRQEFRAEINRLEAVNAELEAAINKEV